MLSKQQLFGVLSLLVLGPGIRSGIFSFAVLEFERLSLIVRTIVCSALIVREFVAEGGAEVEGEGSIGHDVRCCAAG